MLRADAAMTREGLASVLIDGDHFFYYDEGEPTLGSVLLLHGFPDSPASFASLAAALVAQGYRVLRPYLPGYAPSRYAGPFDVGSISNRILKFVTGLDLPALHLVGHDWGAMLAYAILYRRPDLFSASATISVPHPLFLSRVALTSPSVVRRSSYILFFQFPWMPKALLNWSRGELVARLWKRWSPGYALPKTMLAEIQACLANSGAGPFGYYRSLFPSLVSKPTSFGPLQVPLLYVHGDADGCIDVSNARGHEDYFTAGYQLHLLPNVGHFAPAEAPLQLARVLGDWFRAEGAGEHEDTDKARQ